MKKELYIILLMTLLVFSSCWDKKAPDKINSTETEIQVNWWGAQFSDEQVWGVSESVQQIDSWSNASWLDINK
jgi:hypothetical protein